MSPVEQYINRKLQERHEAGNFRALSAEKLPVDFFSNDYLGLVTTGALESQMKAIYGNCGTTGSTGSRLLSGNSAETEALERKIAAFHHAEAALIFNSGYDANVGLLSSLIHKDTLVLYDELCHASIIDGIRLGLTNQRYKFKHNDISDLKDKLNRFSQGGAILIVVESVYSMDGDMAPLPEIVATAQQYGADVIVDEAHATGVFGKHGEGLVSEFQLQDKVFARVHTFGKALGAHGAAVVGSQQLRDFLINFARTFIYTTALPDHSIHAIDTAYNYLKNNTFDNTKLHRLIAHFRKRIIEYGLQTYWIDSLSPIQVIITGNNEKSKQKSNLLHNAGMQVKPILHPTVPRGSERLRICLHSFNSIEEVDRMMEIVGQFIKI